MKTIEIKISKRTEQQLEKLHRNLMDMAKATGVEVEFTVDQIIESSINSNYLRTFEPNPANIAIPYPWFNYLLDIVEKEKELLRNFPLGDISDNVSAKSVLFDLIEKEYKRVNNIKSEADEISDDDLPC